MSILLMLIPLSALIVIGAIIMYVRAVDAGQFDDLERQGRIALFEERLADETPTAQQREERTKPG